MNLRKRLLPLLNAAALAATVCIVYFPVCTHPFSVCDDPEYVVDNIHVHAGLTTAGIVWAFTTFQAANYHPLVWLVHMLAWDCFGDNAAGHHLLNVALHAASSALLLLFLHRSTGSLWRSSLVAAVFALHPLRVESVAWVAELKDALSTFLLMLTLLAWSHYIRFPNSRRYWTAVACFGLGLLTKPMLVTVPVLLLLMDMWPFRRAGSSFPPVGRKLFRLALEKIPFAILSAASAVTTFIAQAHGGAVSTLNGISIGPRVENAILACLRYVLDTFWPVHLAIGYPHPGYLHERISTFSVATAALALIAITTAVVAAARHGRPAMAVGWFWYIISLLPVCGLVQVGLQGRADRYTYIPHIGLLIMIAWALPSPWLRHRSVRGLVAALLGIALAALAWMTHIQLAYWSDDFALTGRAIDVIPRDYIARIVRGTALMKDGRYSEAVSDFDTAAHWVPQLTEVQSGLGEALADSGRPQESLAHFQIALRQDPRHVETQMNYGAALASVGRTAEALRHLRAGVSLRPDLPAARHNYALVLAQSGNLREAVAQWEQALGMRPEYPDAQYGIGIALTLLGRTREAAVHFEAALQFRPDWIDVMSRLAWLRVSSDEPGVLDLAEAERLSRRIINLLGGGPRAADGFDVLALARARMGFFAEAIELAQAAENAARLSHQDRLAQAIASRLEAYRQGQFPQFAYPATTTTSTGRSQEPFPTTR